MSNLPDELRARARYGQLIAVVGQPHTADERELLIFMARWLSDNDADLLVGLIRATTKRATVRDRLLVTEIGALVERATSGASGDRPILIAHGLVQRILAAAAGH
jgi:hypothetical protein